MATSLEKMHVLGSPCPTTQGAGTGSSYFRTSVHMPTRYDTSTKFCKMTKLGERKVFTGSAMSPFPSGHNLWGHKFLWPHWPLHMLILLIQFVIVNFLVDSTLPFLESHDNRPWSLKVIEISWKID